MNNFRFAKIIAGVGPTLAKETVLSKVINMVDAFRIGLGQGFDDNNKKYIDTLMKLDNSKTVLLETKGTDIRVKNVLNVPTKKKGKIVIEYSEYAQENDKRIFIDYPFLAKISKNAEFIFEQSEVILKALEIGEDQVTCEVIQGGEILQYDRVRIPNQITETTSEENGFLTPRDKKDILWGLEYGAHVIALSNTKEKGNVQELKAFLAENNVEKMKIFAKIENKQGLENIDEIISISDGIIFVFDKLQPYLRAKSAEETLIKKCKEQGKGVIVTFIENLGTKQYALFNEENIKKFCALGVDAYMIETMITEDDPLNMITKLQDLLNKNELEIKDSWEKAFYEDNESLVKDYIIYNAYRITNELETKAMVCYTENGYTTSRLSSLTPLIPIISFTKNDETYRYLNMLRGVRGYKISQTFSYENLKKVGKEMIRIIFKGSISLDDKIIIIQANESITEEKTGMINGLELYKFKNI